jgi:GNAT superfamily N-acetyltransferase
VRSRSRDLRDGFPHQSRVVAHCPWPMARPVAIGWGMETNDPIRIRLAEARDLPALGHLGAELVRAHHAFDPQRFMAPGPGIEEGYAWFLGTQLASDQAVVLVAELGGLVVGYAFAGLEERSWKELREAAGFLHDVVVDAHHQGAGVGTRLAEAARAWLIARGAPRVMLWTADRNPGAQRLFHRLGYRATMIEMTRENGHD